MQEPPKLSPEQLREEQESTLSTPRRRYGIAARFLFAFMDRWYGRERSLSKFKVLEIVARVPYQAWEQVAYVAVTHRYSRPSFARRVFTRVQESRLQQDNEQWHLLILEELVEAQGQRETFLRHRVLPQVLAFSYYHLSWVLYVLKPAWSYHLNADFEDHAEQSTRSSCRSTRNWRSSPTTACSPRSTATSTRWRTCSDRSATTSECTRTKASPAWVRLAFDSTRPCSTESTKAPEQPILRTRRRRHVKSAGLEVHPVIEIENGARGRMYEMIDAEWAGALAALRKSLAT